MEHSCKTYFALSLPFDKDKNAALLRERRECLPEEIGIFNKDEIGNALKDAFGVTPEWRRHRFVIGFNETYDTDVNNMLRVTLKHLTGKEAKIRELCKRYSLAASLVVVPYIGSDSKAPKQYLSFEKDIVAFLYLSDSALDFDYYVV